MASKLYVGNLPYSTSEDDLRNLFSQAGAVASVAVIKDRDTGRSKGFAFVEMASEAEADKAVRMFNGYEMDGRPLKVDLARPQEDRGGGFGGGRGGGYGGGGGRGGGSRDRDRRGGGGGTRRY